MLGRPYEEKRKFIRMKVEGEVNGEVRGTGQEILGSAIDISHCGLKFQTPVLLVEGMLVDLTVKVEPEKSLPLDATFLVRRIQKNGSIYVISGEMSDVK